MRILKPLLAVALVAGLAAGAYLSRQSWLPLFNRETPPKPAEARDAHAEPAKVLLSDQAIDNLGLTARPVKLQTFWKTLSVPGMVVDRPGRSDRGVVAPATGVVSNIRRVPGDPVKPGDELFTLRLLSESLAQTQTELFKAAQEVTLARAQRKRLESSGGAIPEARLIEVDQQMSRHQVAVNAYRQELQARGFSPEQIDRAAAGEFLREMSVYAPTRPTEKEADGSPAFEVQELKVGLGQQVQAGQALCLLADHDALAVEGRAFRDETAFVEKGVREGWPVEVDFDEEAASWPALAQEFYVRQIANNIEAASRTFSFLMPLANQSRVVVEGGRPVTLWRYRPGQRVRILLRTEKLENVFVVPADAVAEEGAERFIFTQNVNTFERVPVRVLFRDRRRAALADDGSLPSGSFVVQRGATQLARATRANTGNATPAGYHMHADGSLHKNGDD